MTTVTAIIQARFGATRLPGKTLMSLGDKPVIWHMVERAKAATSIESVVVATTTSPKDDVLVGYLEREGIPYFRGSEDDVLGRYAETARKFKTDVVVRITADDPLKDPNVIEQVVKAYLENQSQYDYVSNVHPPTLPEGQDTEVFSKKALFKAESETTDPYHREHVTAYFYQNTDMFRIHNIANDVDLSHLRWTLDTVEDFKFFQEVYRNLYRQGEIISMKAVLDLLRKQPHIQMINQTVKRSDLYVS